jgi:hypothetical protein
MFSLQIFQTQLARRKTNSHETAEHRYGKTTTKDWEENWQQMAAD